MANLNLKEALTERRQNRIFSLSKTWGILFNVLNSVETKLSQAVRAEPDKIIYICDVYFTEDETYINNDTRRQISNLFIPACLIDEYGAREALWAQVPEIFPSVSENIFFPELIMQESTFIIEEILTFSKNFISFFVNNKNEFETLVYPKIFEIFTKDYEISSNILSIHFLELYGPNNSKILLARFRIIP